MLPAPVRSTRGCSRRRCAPPRCSSSRPIRRERVGDRRLDALHRDEPGRAGEGAEDGGGDHRLAADDEVDRLRGAGDVARHHVQVLAQGRARPAPCAVFTMRDAAGLQAGGGVGAGEQRLVEHDDDVGLGDLRQHAERLVSQSACEAVIGAPRRSAPKDGCDVTPAKPLRNAGVGEDLGAASPRPGRLARASGSRPCPGSDLSRAVELWAQS